MSLTKEPSYESSSRSIVETFRLHPSLILLFKVLDSVVTDTLNSLWYHDDSDRMTKS